MGHGIWPTETKKYYTSKGAVQSETFTADLTTDTLDTELEDFRKDFNNGTGLLINETSSDYLIFKNNLLSLPKLVKQNGLIFLVPGLGDEGRVIGYNAMTRSFIILNFERNSYTYSYDANTLTTPLETVRNNHPSIGVGTRKPTFRLSNTSTNMLVASMPSVGSNWTFSSNVQFVVTMFGEEATIIPSGVSTQEYMYNKSRTLTSGKTYTVSFFLKEEDINIGGGSSSYHCSIVAAGAIITTPVTVRKVSNYLQNSGAIYSTTFSTTALNANIGLLHNTLHRNDSTITLLGIQLEEGSSSHNFIRTVLSQVITPADQLSLDMNALGFDEWTIYLDFSIQTTQDGQPCYIISTDSTAAHSYLYIPDTTTGELATRYGFNGGNMVIGPIPQNTRQRIQLSYSKNKGNGGYAILRREGKDSPIGHEWSTGTNHPKQIPNINHLEFFTGPGFVSAELKAFVIFDKWVDLTEDDLNDI